MGSRNDKPEYEIPTHCKAGVVVNEGPDFHVEMQMVPVPEPGKFSDRVHLQKQLLRSPKRT